MSRKDREVYPISNLTPKRPFCYRRTCRAKTLFYLLGDENSCFWQASEGNRRNCWSYLDEFGKGCQDIHIVDGKRGETPDSLGITGLRIVKPKSAR